MDIVQRPDPDYGLKNQQKCPPVGAYPGDSRSVPRVLRVVYGTDQGLLVPAKKLPAPQFYGKEHNAGSQRVDTLGRLGLISDAVKGLTQEKAVPVYMFNTKKLAVIGSDHMPAYVSSGPMSRFSTN